MKITYLSDRRHGTMAAIYVEDIAVSTHHHACSTVAVVAVG